MALDGRTIVFVEVKTRQSAEAGHPAKRWTSGSSEKLTQMAVSFLKRHRLLEYPARFDVIAITWPPDQRRPTIEHFPNAFEAAGQAGFYS